MIALFTTLCLHLTLSFPMPDIMNNAVEKPTTYEYNNFITGPTPSLPDNDILNSISSLENAETSDCSNQQLYNSFSSPKFEREVQRRIDKLTTRYNRLNFRAHRPLLKHQLKNKVSFLRRVLGNLGQDPSDQQFAIGDLDANRNIPIKFIRALNRAAGETSTVLGYLLAFGYLELPGMNMESEIEEDENREVTPCHLQNALAEFQKFNGLDVTRKLDKATYQKLKVPRCGVPDDIRNKRNKRQEPRSKRHVLRRRGWRSSAKKPLTYHIKNCTSTLPRHICKREITLGIKKWTEVAPIFLREVDASEADSADFTFYFVSGEHPKKDPTSSRNDMPFDGPGGIYAHAYFPRGGHIHFDNDERFTAHSTSGFNLQFVSMHEMGHALGLEHSDVVKSVMSPHYEPFEVARRHGWKEVLRLKEDDKAGIREKYGHGTGFVIPL